MRLPLFCLCSETLFKPCLKSYLYSSFLIASHPEVQIFDRLKRTMSVFPLYHVGGFVINMLHALHSLSCVVYLPRYTFTTYLQAMEKYKVYTRFRGHIRIPYSIITKEETMKPLLHYVMGLHFAKVCEQKHEQKREQKRNRFVFLPNA